MEPISIVQALSASEEAHSVSGRVVSSFGGEIDHLIAATEGEAASATIGTKVDVKA